MAPPDTRNPSDGPQDRPLWTPDPARRDATAMARLDRLRPAGTESLHAWSLADPDAFWRLAWQECGIVGELGATAFNPGADGDLRSAGFFPDARLSYAENLMAGGGLAGADEVAVVFRREDGVRREHSWSQLQAAVLRAAALLRREGVGQGDVVAAWMPNTPEALVAMLAANWIGAVFTSTSPDFGAAGVLDRFGQVEPAILIAADGYIYGGKRHHRLAALHEVVAGLPTLRRVLVVPELDGADEVAEEVVALRPVARVWDPFGEATGAAAEPASSEPAPSEPASSEPARLPFDAPGFILYSSGTTGPPKCIVHRAGGILLKHATEHRLHCDIRPGDRVFYFTTCGWMMWNWLVSALAAGATIVLYDGSPFHPRPEVLWDLAEQERVTLFGTSAKYLDAARKAGLRPAQTHDLSGLRTITSTGSPLSAEGFEYVYRDIAADVHLASISGGTDLCGCFVIGDPTRPVWAGEIQGPALGVAADVWDEAGASLADRPGVRGELVCTAPFPSMPLGFLGDEEGTRYSGAYFERFPGVWAHGDFASRTEHGGFVIHGRSDATLNAGGVRIGTAELYRQVESFPEVAEALAIGQEWEGDTRIVLFMRLADGAALTPDLASAIRTRLRTQCSPRHVPAKMIAVPDLPKTRSGKLAELAVADVVHGREVRNASALANPESLGLFAGLPELAG